MKISKADCPKMIKDTTPVQDGFFMPGEFEQHQGCIMIWPERPGSWRNGAKEAETAFSAVIRAIADLSGKQNGWKDFRPDSSRKWYGADR